VIESGYMRDGAFLLALQHFDRYLPPLDERPVLLILDQLNSHMTLEVVEFCRRRKIILLFLPSKLTWCFQPLDVGVFRTFHAECRRLLAAALSRNLPIERRSIVSIYGAAAVKLTFTKAIIKSAWEESGLWPFNPG
jgi:hypothetical protein